MFAKLAAVPDSPDDADRISNNVVSKQKDTPGDTLPMQLDATALENDQGHAELGVLFRVSARDGDRLLPKLCEYIARERFVSSRALCVKVNTIRVPFIDRIQLSEQ